MHRLLSICALFMIGLLSGCGWQLQGTSRLSEAASGNLAVAACQSRALSGDPPSLAEVERTEAARLLLARCADKFGKS